ncbi:hypothetical protein QE152_g22528 [Popillia japonica]|uniref:Uncharacterized protein n=1 Tax=Popillia japonica TaxID=7064 RepID=A0AAW1KJT2_POPJA
MAQLYMKRMNTLSESQMRTMAQLYMKRMNTLSESQINFRQQYRVPLETRMICDINPKEIETIISSMTYNKSEDIYGLSVVVLRGISEVISKPLAVLFNKWMTDGVFPDELKLARVVPIKKKGDTLELNNYRYD